MNVDKKEKGVLECLLKKISPITEFEVRFGLPIRRFGYDKNRVSREKFIETLKYFRDNYDIKETTTILDIWCKSKNGFNRNNIRVSLEGEDTISEYCKTDKIDPTSSSVKMVYKNNLFWSTDELDNMINELRVWTEFEEGGRKRRLTADYDSDLGVRFSVKSEIPIIYSGLGGRNKYNIDPLYRNYLKENKLLSKHVYRDVDSFNLSGTKVYRYKRRFSFFSADKMFRYDFTIVKSSRKNSRNNMEFTRSFTSSRVLEGLEEYEIEMEYIGESPKDYSKVISSLQENIGTMMGLLQSTDSPIPISEMNDVSNKYKKLIVENWVNRIKDKISVLEGDKDGEHGRELSMLNKRLKNYIYMREGKQQISDRVRIENTFIGPKPYTLELENFGDVKRNPFTIESGYSVTDKADGIRMLMYINDKGHIYYIDNRFHIKSKRIGKYVAKKSLYDTVIDGEWVERASDGSRLNIYLAFDIYFHGGKSVEDLPLLGTKSKPGRYDILKSVFEEMSKDITEIKTHFWYKKFYFCNSSKDIFSLSKECYEDDREYNIDGLIFTPMYLPVGVDGISESGFKLDKKSSKYVFNATSGSWKRALKWKPLDEQSIDFFVEFEKKDGKQVILNKLVEIDGVEHSIAYKRMKLFVGANKSDKDLMMRMNPCMEVAGAVVSSKTGNYTVPMLFRPHYNWYTNLDTANVPLSNRNRLITVDGVKSGNILGSIYDSSSINVRDKSVVEFVYDGLAPEGFRWKILRVREDKTEEYDRLVHKRGIMFRTFMDNRDKINNVIRFEEGHNYTLSERNMVNTLWRDCNTLFRAFGVKMRGNIYERVLSLKDAMSADGISIIKNESDIPIHFNYGNYYTTAFNVWNAINNPITNDMLFGRESIPELDDDRYYRANIDRSESQTYRMQLFHNKYIKSTLIHLATKGKREPTLLDLCCGKAGDLFKWKSAGIKKVLGVDVSRDNIYNKGDGACVRYMNMARTASSVEMMDIDFLVGDCGNLMSSLEAFTDERSSEYYMNNYLEMDGTPMKFDIVSTQFAIHYFFNTRSRVDTFLRNVEEHLLPGGLFIGTVLNGASVYERLCAKPDETMISEYDDRDNLVWSIERKFKSCSRTGNDFYDLKTNEPVNFEIEIRLPSITGEGVSYKEWLVNFDYLVKRAKERNLVLYRDANIPATDIFESLYNINMKRDSKIEMTSAEKKLSFMYRYFIFRKEV